jgi:succinate-acetate transporter protein
MNEENQTRRIDVLAIGLFGLAVGALTLGVAQLGWIQHKNMVGALVIALIFGGIVQLLAGITDIRYNEQLGGTALTMYGFLWITLCTVKLVSTSSTFQFDAVLYAPINLVYAVFSAVMIFLTAYRNLTLSALHVVITVTFLATTFARLDFISELLPGWGLTGCGKTHFESQSHHRYAVWDDVEQPRRMRKKAVQQGRSEHRGESYSCGTVSR